MDSSIMVLFYISVKFELLLYPIFVIMGFAN